jgi:hypothetical protein
MWIVRPLRDGWYWHRYNVDDHAIYNVCCVTIVSGRTFVHYLGDTEQVAFRENSGDVYWGPLERPPT